jgi:RNA polymerase sigma-70 factor (ECF subfamily)
MGTMTQGAKWVMADRIRQRAEAAVARRVGRPLAEEGVADAVARLDKADVETADELLSWLVAVGHNCAVDRARKDANRRMAETRLAGEPQLSVAADVPSMEAERRTEVCARVRRKLSALPPRERRALVLRHVEGEPVDRIALALGTTYKGAESVLARGRAAFRAAWSSESGVLWPVTVQCRSALRAVRRLAPAIPAALALALLVLPTTPGARPSSADAADATDAADAAAPRARGHSTLLRLGPVGVPPRWPVRPSLPINRVMPTVALAGDVPNDKQRRPPLSHPRPRTDEPIATTVVRCLRDVAHAPPPRLPPTYLGCPPGQRVAA